MGSRRASCTIYVGNLPVDVRESEIEDLFRKYGNIVYIDMKLPSRPPGYCFVEFEDPRDAEDAIRGRDGYSFDGLYLRVELAHGGRGLAPSSNERSRSYNNGRANISRRAEYRVVVSKLPSTASWQDLKDHMRKAGDVSYAQVFREGGETKGVVDYTNYDDMKYAIRKLDDSDFQNRYSRARIRVYEDKKSGSRRNFTPSRSRSRSRSGGPANSRSRSPSKSRHQSRSPSPLHPCIASRSRSASHSRSPLGSPPSKIHDSSPR